MIYEINSKRDKNLLKLCKKINEVRFIVAITGAGISCASGLPLVNEEIHGTTLRQFFKPELIHDDPVQFYKIYRTILSNWRSARPNKAHIALATRGVWIITLNIDGLHRDAGSEHIIEVHGNLREIKCPTCEVIYHSALSWSNLIPRCPQCKTVLQPGISLEGQEIRHFSRAMDWVGRAEVLIVVGTSLEMHPMNQLPEVALRNDADVIYVNNEADDVLPKLLQS